MACSVSTAESLQDSSALQQLTLVITFNVCTHDKLHKWIVFWWYTILLDLTVARQNAHVHNITNGSRIMKQWWIAIWLDMLPQANLKEVVKNKIIRVLYNNKDEHSRRIGGKRMFEPCAIPESSSQSPLVGGKSVSFLMQNEGLVLAVILTHCLFGWIKKNSCCR